LDDENESQEADGASPLINIPIPRRFVQGVCRSRRITKLVKKTPEKVNLDHMGYGVIIYFYAQRFE
jgi:hypothetical protein